MFVQMKWHKSAPDGQTVEFAFGRTGSDKHSVKITSFLNTLKKKNIFFYLVKQKNILLFTHQIYKRAVHQMTDTRHLNKKSPS